MKIIKGIINVLTTLIIIIGGAFLTLYFCGIVPYVVLSGSMEPTIQTGSLCFVNKKANFNSIKIKDIIAYKMKDGTLVTHRVVSISNKGIQTKGDRNKGVDNTLITKNNFVGKDVFWIPKLGYAVVAFQSTKGKIVLITCIVFMLIFAFFFNENTTIEKTKKEN